MPNDARPIRNENTTTKQVSAANQLVVYTDFNRLSSDPDCVHDMALSLSPLDGKFLCTLPSSHWTTC